MVKDLTELDYNICKYCGRLIRDDEEVCSVCDREVYTDEKGGEALRSLLWELRDKGVMSYRQ